MNTATALSPAERALDRLALVLRTRPPAGVSVDYLDAFLDRHRPTLVAAIADALAHRTSVVADPPDLWTPMKRTAANLDALAVLARVPANALTARDRQVLAAYSGWGGLSLDGVADRLPAGIPAPETRGLIHEYYTPTLVARELARIVGPLLTSLPRSRDGVLALEPSAGIGRFLRTLTGTGFEDLSWTAVEWSAVSARLLKALWPHLTVFEGPFERWVRDHGASVAGQLGLVVANPPYGQRGAAIAEDPVREYREPAAWAYFLRRSLDLLAPHGLGVFVVPGSFLTSPGAAATAVRERVLLRHHLAGAFRLPSKLFPGASLVTDLLFFRARGGALAEIDPEDRAIADGGYFRTRRDHVLGTEVGIDDGGDPLPGRFAYRVDGVFTHLPDLVERPICSACVITPTGIRPVAVSAPSPVVGAPEGDELDDALALGSRVHHYLALAAGADGAHVPLWRELRDALVAWRTVHGPPHAHKALLRAAKQAPMALRFLAAFEPNGSLLRTLDVEPRFEPRFAGDPRDLAAVATFLFRSARHLTVGTWLDQVGEAAWARVRTLFAEGWCIDNTDGPLDAHPPRAATLWPKDVYLTGPLWPRLDRAVRFADRDPQLAAQVAALRAAIAPVVFEDIAVSARAGWIPLDLVSHWLSVSLQANYGPIELERDNGLVTIRNLDYNALEGSREVSPTTRWCLGWMNHDRTMFSPTHGRNEDIDQKRLQIATEWETAFRAYLAADEGRRGRIEDAYNRAFRGFVAPTYSAEPLHIARWAPSGVRLRDHQIAGARRVLANRGGLVAFDVGVGKTYTGIAVLARARQEGWSRRPVLVVPNSIVWKWEADLRRVLPDYRVAVIGSVKKQVARGPRKGQWTSETDTPAERARKWTRFQAGEVDVVVLTHTAIARTRMSESFLRGYADGVEAVRREVHLRQRTAEQAKRPTERQVAILQEGVAAWIAEQTELPEAWEYDPGIVWDDLGVDLLIVDEAQAFKNLYLPEPREGGVPRFMGNAGSGAKRAWQMDFRCASVRKRTGGAGVVLLSATPAKNSPLEFYNLVQYVDPAAWTRLGIRDSEQFIDRYLRIELRPVVDTKMEVVDRAAVTGFTNLHELRDVLFRYGEFKTAEDVGLVLPEPRVSVVEVDMSDAQEAKYQSYVARIEALLSGKGNRKANAGEILGLLTRLALVAVHPELDAGFDWRTADTAGVDPHAPKFDALATRVLANRRCGHIVFCDNLAAHRWVVRTLVDAGIPADRIATLNGESAKAPADRQRIAQEFNGTPDEGIEPRYDVLVANAVAYEGIDLQTRTCAIHHLDLPWEPATLQQRNGRGVRQGNTLARIDVVYYFAKRSLDGLRFNLIQGKLGWMTELLKSQRRDTNNPGAQMDLGPEDMLLLVSRDPEQTRSRLAEVKARRELEARTRVAAEASGVLRTANARYRKAETADPHEAARLRAEAEVRLADLGQVDSTAWPWAPWRFAVRSTSVLVPTGGAGPVYDGLRVVQPHVYDASLRTYMEFGRVRGQDIGLRHHGAAVWGPRDLNQIASLKIRPDQMDAEWPAEPTLDAEIRTRVDAVLRNGQWPTLGWSWASDAWLSGVWERHHAFIRERLAHAPSWYAPHLFVPIVVADTVRRGHGAEITTEEVLAPTDAGWERFIRLARNDATPTEGIHALAVWWGRPFPRRRLADPTEEAV